MGLEKLAFDYWDSSGKVADLIEKWDPKGFRTEKEYENSLYDYLHSKLKEVQVTKQYGQGRIRADLMVGDDVLIELKNNLKTTAQYQRMIGQLDAYQDWGGHIILILCGKTCPNLKKSLNEYLDASFEEGEVDLFFKPEDEENKDDDDESEGTNWLLIAGLLIVGYIIFIGS